MNAPIASGGESPAKKAAPRKTPAKSAPARDTAGNDAPARTTAAEQTAAKKAAAKKAAPGRPTPEPTTPVDAAPRTTSARKSAPEQPPPKQAPPKQAPSQQAPSKQAPPTQAPSKQAPSKQAPPKQAPPTQTPSKQAVAKKSPAKKTAKKAEPSHPDEPIVATPAATSAPSVPAPEPPTPPAQPPVTEPPVTEPPTVHVKTTQPDTSQPETTAVAADRGAAVEGAVVEPGDDEVAAVRPVHLMEPLVRAVRAYPAYAPEFLALAAVEHLGAEARRYAAWLRDTYPDAQPDGMARLAAQRFIRLARNEGAAAGMAGSFAVLLESAGLGWLQARLVLHLAASYGHDPADPVRASELLVLQRVHSSLATAQAALDAVRHGVRNAPVRKAAPGILTSRLATPVGRALGMSAARAGVARSLARVVPGGGAVVGALTGARSTERLAVRATRYYRELAGNQD
jgi:hypothetical protein